MVIDHVYETLKVGISALAAGTARIQERLWETWLVIHTLEEDDFPLELREEFRTVSDALTRPRQGAIAASEVVTLEQVRAACEGLDNEQARELALLIMELFAHVSANFWPTHKKAN
jgi:hypothetical protein